MQLNYKTDEEGFLQNPDDWNKEVAEDIARKEGVEMDEERWKIVNYLRGYYEKYQIAPAERILIQKMTEMFGKEKKSIPVYLNELFKLTNQACKIAGLPKNAGCV